MQPTNLPIRRSSRLPHRPAQPQPQPQLHPPPNSNAWSTPPAPPPYQQNTPAILPPAFSPSPLAFPLPIQHPPRHTSNKPPPAPAPALATPQRHHNAISRGAKPAVYSLDIGPVNVPGSREYYGSWGFRARKREGRVHVPGQGQGQGEGQVLGQGQRQGQEQRQTQARRSARLPTRPSGSENDNDNDDNEDVDEDPPQLGRRAKKAKSLILVFSAKSVRRADAGRKRDLRAWRAKRRMLSLQRMGGALAYRALI